MPSPSLEKAIFQAAIQLTDVAQRSEYLKAACQGDTALRARIEELLAASEDNGFMQNRAVDSLVETDTGHLQPPLDENQTSQRVGPYKILEQIGEGGFGTVFMAEQETPVRRRIALKVIKPGMDTKQVIARFEAERQALALMDHPHIAKVLDAGQTAEGRPYFAMELVRGVPITEYCDEQHLSTQERLRLFVEICSAVQHAHQKGIIHRDIKPANVLVYSDGDRPVPKIIDFGIAKATQGRLTDKTLFTQFRQFIGTPAYMSPEQARMSGIDIDTRSDIYSLGVLLYELLTGKTPFDAAELARAGFEEMCRRIREDAIPTPSRRLSSLHEEELATLANNRQTEPTRLDGLLRGDLDWIVMKAVEKDRGRRYETASALAEDIQRYARQEPVSAVPPSTGYQLRKFVKRNKSSIAIASTLAGLLVLGTTISTWQAIRAYRAEREQTRLRESAQREASRARASELTAQRTAYASDMLWAWESFHNGSLRQATELLHRYVSTDENKPDLRGWEWRALRKQIYDEAIFCLRQPTSTIHSVAISPDERWLATSNGQGVVRIWNLDERRQEQAFGKQVKDSVFRNDVFFSPRGDRLFAGTPNGVIKCWEVPSWSETAWQADHGGPLRSMDMSLDGQWLVAFGRDSVVSVWDLASDSERRQKSFSDGGDYAVGAITISPDNRLLAVGQYKYVRILNLETLDVLKTIEFIGGRLTTALDFSPDGNFLVCGFGFEDRAVHVVDTETWTPSRLPIRHKAYITKLRFSPDGRLLASASRDCSVTLWETDTWEPLEDLRGHIGEAWSLAFSPDGQRLACGSKGGQLRVWRAAPNPGPTWPTAELHVDVAEASLSFDGQTIAACYADGSVRLLNTVDGQIKRELPELGTDNDQVLFAQERMLLAVGSRASGIVRIVDLEGSEPALVRTIETGGQQVWPVQFVREGKWLLTQSDHEFALWDDQAKQIGSQPSSQAMFAEPIPNTDVVLVGDLATSTAAFWEVGKGSLEAMDDRQLADYSNATIDLANPRIRDYLKEQVLSYAYINAPGPGLAISPDGKRLATGDGVWDIESHREVCRLKPTGAVFSRVSFSGDGTSILARGNTNSFFHIWRAPEWGELQESQTGN